MIDQLLAYIAPHHCSGCVKIGTLLCDSCKYDIENETYARCILCGHPAGLSGLCGNCNVPYDRAWCVGERSGALRQLIDNYKFQHISVAHIPLADALNSRIDQLPVQTIIVPVPTVWAHIRERGYDHTLLLADRIAKHRHLQVKQILTRRTSTKQRDADRNTRLAQAKEAFSTIGTLDSSVPYLLIDDVVTTGATIHYAAKTLREAGARDIWVATIARQPLD